MTVGETLGTVVVVKPGVPGSDVGTRPGTTEAGVDGTETLGVAAAFSGRNAVSWAERPGATREDFAVVLVVVTGGRMTVRLTLWRLTFGTVVAGLIVVGVVGFCGSEARASWRLLM